MKTIMGLVRAGAAARSRFRGRDISSALAPTASRRRGLGWVPEDRRIFTDLTVRENLAVGAPAARDGRAGLDRGAAVRAVSRTSRRCPSGPAAA